MVFSLKKSQVPGVEQAKQIRQGMTGATARQLRQHGSDKNEFHDLPSVIKSVIPRGLTW